MTVPPPYTMPRSFEPLKIFQYWLYGFSGKVTRIIFLAKRLATDMAKAMSGLVSTTSENIMEPVIP